MIFQQYYLDCLSQASYLIGDERSGRAVVVDPRRDVDEYVTDAADAGLRVELVIETHFHADFLSGHLELAEATGAQIGIGAAATDAEFPHRRLADGESIDLGDVKIVVLATPGHTPESISLVVYEHGTDTVPYGVLTGDTLFIGDVGRPDLLSSVGVTAGELASQLYDSLHTKLLRLPDATRVFPAHGAGSACGKNLSTATWSTLGEQRATNYALAPLSREEFVDVVTDGQPSAPAYFGFDATLNRTSHALLDDAGPGALSLDEVVAEQRAGALVVDARDHAVFAQGHLAGSINVGLDGRFSESVGTVVPPGSSIILVTEPGAEHEAKLRLARIGFDEVHGALDDPYAAFAAHPEAVQRSSRLTVDELRDRLEDAALGVQLVDVRNLGEHRLGAIDRAVHIPLAELRSRMDELDRTAPVVVHCAGGYRSSAAASLLASEGFTDVSDLLGGYTAWSTVSP